MMKFKSNLDKTIEVLLYLSTQTTSFQELLILIFKADISHLNKHGRPITGLNYIKENNHITIQELNNLIKYVSIQNSIPFLIIEQSLIPKRSANLRLLSESDKQALSQRTSIDICKILENTSEGEFFNLKNFIDNEEVLEYLDEIDTLSIVI
jgi:hypothetical protein